MDKVKSEVGKRMDQLLWRYRQNDRAFELDCGLASATIYKARNDGRITSETARRIIQKHPELSLSWILYGEGEMIGNRNEDRYSLVEAMEKLTRSIDRLTATINQNVCKKN